MTLRQLSEEDDEVMLPHLRVADLFDGYVNVLLAWVRAQPDVVAREGYVDLMVGLATAAEAMRASARSERDSGVDHLRSAVHHLEQAAESPMRIPWAASIRAAPATAVTSEPSDRHP